MNKVIDVFQPGPVYDSLAILTEIMAWNGTGDPQELSEDVDKCKDILEWAPVDHGHATDLVVSSNDDYLRADEFVQALNAQLKLIDKTRKALKSPLKALESKINEMFANQKLLVEAKALVVEQLSQWNARQEAVAEEAQREADEMAGALGAIAPQILPATKGTGTTSYRNTWEVEVDIVKLAAFVAQSPAHAALLKPDMKVLRALARDTGKEGEVLPGVIATKRRTAVTKSKG